MAEPKKTPEPTVLLLCVNGCGNALAFPLDKRDRDAITRLIGKLAASDWLMSVVHRENGFMGPLCPECQPECYADQPGVLETAKARIEKVGQALATVKLLNRAPKTDDWRKPD
jgi:hypothetical protein